MVSEWEIEMAKNKRVKVNILERLLMCFFNIIIGDFIIAEYNKK